MRARKSVLAFDLLENAGEGASQVLGVMLSIVGFDAEITDKGDGTATVRCLGCNAEASVSSEELRTGLFTGGFKMAHRCPPKLT